MKFMTICLFKKKIKELSLFFLGFAGLIGHASELPNILLIVSEDNGPELGCYGDPFAKTPIIDEMARNGLRFNRAFTPYSVCSPSRASFLTGLHPVVNGHLGLATHKFSLCKEWPNILGLLKEAGYRTGLIGKLHVNPEEFFAKHIDYRAISGANFERKILDTYSEKAGEFFSQNEKPFFLSINYPDAHFPLIPIAGGYPEKKNFLTGDDVKPLPWVGCDNQRIRDATANYYNSINRLDSLVGNLLNELKIAGKSDHTMIIYIGDHGAQFSRGKTGVYDAGVRIPFIINWPGKVKRGMVVEQLVCVTDILPTCLVAAGVKIPEKLSGFALQPFFKGMNAPGWRNSLQFITTGAAPSLAFLQLAYRTSRYKLIITPRGQGENLSAVAYLNDLNSFYVAGCKQHEINASSKLVRDAYRVYKNPPQYELYDLKNDPHEFINLAYEQQFQKIRIQLHHEFFKWQKKAGDPFINEENIKFWINEQKHGIKINYKKIKNFRWGYLNQFY